MFLSRGKFSRRENHLPFVLRLSVTKEQRPMYATSNQFLATAILEMGMSSIFCPIFDA